MNTNWINNRKHTYEGEINRSHKGQAKYSVAKPGEKGMVISSRKSLEEIRSLEKYAGCEIKELITDATRRQSEYDESKLNPYH